MKPEYPKTCASCQHSAEEHTQGYHCSRRQCRCVVFVPHNPIEALRKGARDAEALGKLYGKTEGSASDQAGLATDGDKDEG